MLRPYVSMLRPCTRPDPTQFDHMRPDLHAELFQQHLAHRAAGDPRHRLAGAAAVTAHAPLQLGVDALRGQGQPGGDPLEDRHQAASVRLARRREAERHATSALSITPPTSITSPNLHVTSTNLPY